MDEALDIFGVDQPKGGMEGSKSLYTSSPQAFTLRTDLNLRM